MIVRAPEERFSTAPAGTYPAVCVDIIDLGKVANRFDPDQEDKQMVRIVWQIDEQDDHGKPFHVRKDYTASLHEKANLRKHLEAWRGRPFSATELFGFDLDSTLGTGCLLSIVHATGSRGGTFANVGAVMKLARGMTAPIVRDYVRVKDRETPTTPVSAPRQQRPVEQEPPEFGYGITDDDIPF